MICPNCNNIIALKRNRCERCGEDITTYKKLIMLSNRYYNDGLEKAKVRDLSGAILVLNKSLEINKRNTSARNLLGLVYYEVGETVSALSEWVISKHFNSEDNDADDYMNALQSNPTKLEALNQTIKKYNLALASAKSGSEDLAIIQLKKVVSLNPKFIKAIQLLALLYMKTGENEKALRYLTKANKVDVSNTITLRYMKEIEERMGTNKPGSKEDIKDSGKESKKTEQVLFPRTSYKEYKPNVWVYVNLILGIIIGCLVIFYLVVPNINRSHINKLASKDNEFYAELNKQTLKISTLEEEKAALEKKVEEIKGQVKTEEVIEYDETIYDNLFEAVMIYNEELEKGNPREMDYLRIAEALSKVKIESLERIGAITIYEKIKDVSFLKAAKNLYDEGHALYSSKKYEESLAKLQEAYLYDETNVNIIYFIGRSYHQLKDMDNAIVYYNIIVDQYPDSNRATEARSKLSSINP